MHSDPIAKGTGDPFEGHLKPPPGLWRKFGYYSRRYGVVHALCSYLGRSWLGSWLLFGPVVSQPYLKRWLASPGPHVLNLGGGGVLARHWLTADMTPRADVFVDITKPLPLDESVLDGIFSEEVIEHIPRPAGAQMLDECFRVLKPGGTIRVTTPSLDYFAKHAALSIEGTEAINDIFYSHGHAYIYSTLGLEKALRDAGFVNIRQSFYRDPISRYGSFDSHPARFAFAPPEWSQYWEADKPCASR